MDSLGNVLTKIRNAYAVHQTETTVPLAKLNAAVLRVLAREGYITAVTEEKVDEQNRSQLKVVLKYVNRLPALARVRRLSKPGRRVYANAGNFPRPKGGYGTIVVSTNQGIFSSTEAKKRGLGGELLCEVIRGEGQ
jgi:small subunit ribosomal protein S8